MTRKILRIGARGSALSLRQTEIVAELLRAVDPEIEVETVVITTTGDRQLDTPLPLIGGKGVFTEEIETALLSREIDFAVHSLKDLPVESREGIVVGAIPERGSAEDLLFSRSGLSLRELPAGARVGTSSLRRAAQLLLARSDLRPVSIRGNVETRLRKAGDPLGEFDAIVLAKAGIDRLGLTGLTLETLPIELMLPAPGQGALAVQARDESLSLDLLGRIDHQETSLATMAERAFLSGLGGGCSTPVAAFGIVEQSRLHLRGRVIAVDGSHAIDVRDDATVTSRDGALDLGKKLAEEALALGAGALVGAPS